MNIDLVIPTKNRKQKLINCISSLEKIIKDNIHVYIYFSEESELEYFKYLEKNFTLCLVKNYRVPEFWNTHLKYMTSDVMLCCNDDILFKEDSLIKLEECFNIKFPDFDGVIGLNQSNILKEQALDSAFCAIGKKYTERFPNKAIWCPEYYRFYADKELGEYAKSINKFYYAEEVEIIHLHPAFDKSQLDETHDLVRKYLNFDRDIYNERKSKGYLWGSNFNLVNRGDK